MLVNGSLIVTVPAHRLVKPFNARMPAPIQEDNCETWIDPSFFDAEQLDLMLHRLPGGMEARGGGYRVPWLTGNGSNPPSPPSSVDAVNALAVSFAEAEGEVAGFRRQPGWRRGHSDFSESSDCSTIRSENFGENGMDRQDRYCGEDMGFVIWKVEAGVLRTMHGGQ